MSANRGRFTRETANMMRQRGLAVRRFNAELRGKRYEPGPPPKAPQAAEAAASNLAAPKPPLGPPPATPIANAPAPLPGNVPARDTRLPPEMGYGYELAPGVWMERRNPPAKPQSTSGPQNLVGLLRAQRARAQERRAHMLQVLSKAATA
jgi:hypothetical protein